VEEDKVIVPPTPPAEEQAAAAAAAAAAIPERLAALKLPKCPPAIINKWGLFGFWETTLDIEVTLTLHNRAKQKRTKSNKTFEVFLVMVWYRRLILSRISEFFNEYCQRSFFVFELSDKLTNLSLQNTL
jgi:hypothetical protein